MITQAVLVISPDEPCWGLREVDEMVPQPNGSVQRRRVQSVRVIRNDRPAVYKTDLGPAEDFVDCIEQEFISLGDDTVGEMMEMAEKDRYDDHWQKRRKEIAEGSTLIKDYMQQTEARWKTARNQSVFGPGYTRQRNGFPMEATRALERRARRRS